MRRAVASRLRFYSSEAARRKALPTWLHHYNHHRPHTATGGSRPSPG
ncbi:integrase core domain-containing protein [Micromonospora sp. AP08]